MFRKLIATTDDWAPLFARLALGIMIFPHGAQKLLGWWGGGGYSATVAGFGQMGMPAVITTLVLVAEFFGGLGLILGFLSRIAAAGVGLVMVGAVLLVHVKNGFFMNWYGVPNQGHGVEFHILAIGLALVVLLKGAGKWSVDGALAGK